MPTIRYSEANALYLSLSDEGRQKVGFNKFAAEAFSRWLAGSLTTEEAGGEDGEATLTSSFFGSQGSGGTGNPVGVDLPGSPSEVDLETAIAEYSNWTKNFQFDADGVPILDPSESAQVEALAFASGTNGEVNETVALSTHEVDFTRGGTVDSAIVTLEDEDRVAVSGSTPLDATTVYNAATSGSPTALNVASIFPSLATIASTLVNVVLTITSGGVATRYILSTLVMEPIYGVIGASAPGDEAAAKAGTTFLGFTQRAFESSGGIERTVSYKILAFDISGVTTEDVFFVLPGTLSSGLETKVTDKFGVPATNATFVVGFTVDGKAVEGITVANANLPAAGDEVRLHTRISDERVTRVGARSADTP